MTQDAASNDAPSSLSTAGDDEAAGGAKVLEEAELELPYVPDFLLDETIYWFVPDRQNPQAVFHELVGKSATNWSSYYSRKGWNFVHGDREDADGPWRVRRGKTRLQILEPGRIFAPKPLFRFEAGGNAVPIVSLEKRRPINPWKPNYLPALNFIKKYDWPRSVPRRVQAAVWEIEECGQIAGSTSWINAEAILLDSDTDDVRQTLSDLFYNRPEDYALGSEVYLRVLGNLGDEGFELLLEQAKHPITKKRCHVAEVLGKLRDPRGVETLLMLLEDEDFGARNAALRALAKVGVSAADDPEGKIRNLLESDELPHRVWAAAALFSGGDEVQRKSLIQLVKEEKRPLADLGELGELIADLDLQEATPFLIQRLKSEDQQVSLDAAEVLQKVTGLTIEYHADGSDEQRRVAIRTFNRWWEERKRERSAQKRGGKK